jgi:hypothetical protein
LVVGILVVALLPIIKVGLVILLLLKPLLPLLLPFAVIWLVKGGPSNPAAE